MSEPKRVRIADLKDHLSHHLRAVEAGAEVVVTDRERPIAKIVPMPPDGPRADIVAPARDFAAVRDRRRPRTELGRSSTDLLLDDRRDRGRIRR
jgi:prevent-host-death family protein